MAADRSDFYIDTETAFDAGEMAAAHDLMARLHAAGVTSSEDWAGAAVVSVVDSWLQEHGVATGADRTPTLADVHQGGRAAVGGPAGPGTQPRTKTGRVLSEHDLASLAAEAERGYDPAQLRQLPHHDNSWAAVRAQIIRRFRDEGFTPEYHGDSLVFPAAQAGDLLDVIYRSQPGRGRGRGGQWHKGPQPEAGGP